MKLILFSVFCFFLSFSFGQDGYKVIARAEKQIQKGHYNKALRLLNKADSMNYGFCGLAWIEARNAIAYNRLFIRAEKGEYLKAANELNNGDYFLIKNIDSLKMSYFMKSIDRASIKNEIDSYLDEMTSIDSFDIIAFELSLDVKFSEKPFGLSFDTSYQIYKEIFLTPGKDKGELVIDRFRSAVRDQSFYKLLL